MIKRFKYHIVLHIIICIWGFTAILGVFIDANAFVLVWFRVLIAFVFLFLFLFITKKNWLIKNRRQTLKTLGVGVLVALHWLTFYLGIKASSASLLIICMSTATIHVAWLEPLVMKRRFLPSEFYLGLIIIGGIVLITYKGTPEINYLGVGYGLVSALLAAFFGTFNAKLIHEVSASLITLYEMFSATIVMTLILFFMGELTLDKMAISSSDLWYLLFLGVVCTSVAFLVTVEITRFLGAYTVALSINMEPIYTLGLAIVLLKEHLGLTVSFYIGALVIVSAVFINAFLKVYQSKQFKKTFI